MNAYSKIIPPAAAQQKKRGIIIVDTGVLFMLATRVPLEFFINPPDPHKPRPRLLDILSFLGRNGYEVIIPEMVGYEAAQVLRDGKTLSSYFSVSKMPLISIIAEYLNTALNCNAIRIAPPPDTDQTDAAHFVRRLYAIHTKKGASPGEKRFLLRIEQQKIDKKNFGDIAARQLMKTMQNTAAPVFYLCEDTGALQAARRACGNLKVNILTITNLFGALLDQDAWTALNIRLKTREDLFPSIADSLKFAGLNVVVLGRATFTNPINQQNFSVTLAGIGNIQPQEEKIMQQTPVPPQRPGLRSFLQKVFRSLGSFVNRRAPHP